MPPPPRHRSPRKAPLLAAAAAILALGGGGAAPALGQGAPGPMPTPWPPAPGAPPSSATPPGGGAAPGAGNPAAERAAREAIPLTPEMILDLARRYNETQRAREAGVQELAVPVNRPVNMGFAPGAPTAIVNTARGYPTAMSFFDVTGQPWPVQWTTNSNPAAGGPGGAGGESNCNAQPGGPSSGGPSVSAVGFHVCVPVRGSNVVEITPMSLVPRGGLIVSLQGAPKPLTFLLLAGGGRYDASLSVHVADRGPRARIDVVTRPDAPETGAPFLTAMLSGVPPAEAVPLAVEGVSPEGLRAWRLGRNVYLRTSHTLLSPEWTASVAEGSTTVYAVPATPVVLLSVAGRTVSARLRE